MPSPKPSRLHQEAIRLKRGQAQNGHAVTNSREVADFFGKDHKNLIQKVGSLLKNQHTPSQWYMPVHYTHEQNGQPAASSPDSPVASPK
jgi:hypothetical protein